MWWRKHPKYICLLFYKKPHGSYASIATKLTVPPRLASHPLGQGGHPEQGFPISALLTICTGYSALLGAVPCITGCLTGLHACWVTIALPIPGTTTKNDSRHCQVSPGGGKFYTA